MDLTTTLIAACLTLCGLALMIFVSKRPGAIPIVFFFVSAFYLLLDSVPLPTFRGSGFKYPDVVSLFLLLAFVSHYGIKRLVNFHQLPKISLLLWLLLLPPILIGFLHGYNPVTVLRDARILLYYAMVFPLYYLFTEHSERIARFTRMMYYFTIFAVVAYFVLKALNIQFYKGRTTYDYYGSEIYTWWGLHSWVYLYLFGILYLFPRLIFRMEKHRVFASVVFLVFNFVLFGLLIRTMFLGWVAGMAFLVVMLSQRFKRRSLVWGVSALVILGATLLINTPVDALRHVTVVARYGSLVSPDLKYKAAEGTARVRFESLEQFQKNDGIYYALGEGYGDPTLMYDDKRDKRRLERMAHSAWGWMLTRLGVVGTSLYSLLMLVMVFRRRYTGAVTETMITDLSLRAFLVGILAIGFGSNVLFFENFTIIQVVLVLALIEACHRQNQLEADYLQKQTPPSPS